MNYIVGTHSYLLIIELDELWNINGYKVLNNGHHYGIGLLNDTIISKNEEDILNVYERTDPFKLINTITLSGNNNYIHQVSCANGGIYYANTDFNSIVYHGLYDNVRHEYHLNDKTTDANHINSVFPVKDKIISLLHNRGSRSEVVILDHDSINGFKVFNSFKLWHSGCHNIYIDDNYLYYNASSEGKFIVVDIVNRSIDKIINFPGHTKGLSFDGKHIVIGVSQHSQREQRYNSRSYLAVIDKDSHEFITMIDINIPELQYAAGNINEIRYLSHDEHAHSNLNLNVENMKTFKLVKYDLLLNILKNVKKFVTR